MITNSADSQVIFLWSFSLRLAHRRMLRILREEKLRRVWRRLERVARRAPSLFLTASELFSFFSLSLSVERRDSAAGEAAVKVLELYHTKHPVCIYKIKAQITPKQINVPKKKKWISGLVEWLKSHISATHTDI